MMPKLARLGLGGLSALLAASCLLISSSALRFGDYHDFKDVDELEHRIATEINATLNGSLTGRSKLGVLPEWVVQPVQAITMLNNPVQMASMGVVTIHNMYVAIDSYRNRKTVDKQIQDAILLSRLAAIETAGEYADDEEAVDQIWSQDSYQSLENLVQVTSRIRDLCTEEVNLTGPEHPQYAELTAAVEVLHGRVSEHEEVKNHVQTTVCSGLWQNIEDQLYRANDAARRYPGAAFDDKQKEGDKESLYWKSANKSGNIHYRNPLDDEYDPRPTGTIMSYDFKYCTAQWLKDRAQCEHRQPGYGQLGSFGSLIDSSGGNKSDTGKDELKKELEESFENASRLAMSYLAGFEDTPCPRQEVDPCLEQIMRCIPNGIDLLDSVNRQWKKADRAAAIKKHRNGFIGKLKQIWGGVQKVAGKVLLVNTIGKILKFVFKFRENLKRLLKGAGLEGFAVKQVWKRLIKPVGEAVHKTITGKGNFIDRFIANKIGNQVKGLSLNVAKGFVKGKIAPTPTNLVSWMHGFSWMGVKWAKKIRVVDSCIEAARKLDKDEHVDSKAAEAMAEEAIEEAIAEEEEDEPQKR